MYIAWNYGADMSWFWWIGAWVSAIVFSVILKAIVDRYNRNYCRYGDYYKNEDSDGYILTAVFAGWIGVLNLLFFFVLFGGIAASYIYILIKVSKKLLNLKRWVMPKVATIGMLFGIFLWFISVVLWLGPSYEVDLALAKAQATKESYFKTDWESRRQHNIGMAIFTLQKRWAKDEEDRRAEQESAMARKQVERELTDAYMKTTKWRPLQWVRRFDDPQSTMSFDANGGFEINGLGSRFGGGGAALLGWGLGLGGGGGTTDPLNGNGSIKATGRYKKATNQTIEFGWWDVRYVPDGAYTTSSLPRTMVVRQEMKNWHKPPEISFLPRHVAECLTGEKSILLPEKEDVFFNDCMVKAVIRGSSAQLRLF